MPRKTKTAKRRPQKRKSPDYAGIESMNRTMETSIKTIGNVAMAGMAIGLAGSVIGGLK